MTLLENIESQIERAKQSGRMPNALQCGRVQYDALIKEVPSVETTQQVLELKIQLVGRPAFDVVESSM